MKRSKWIWILAVMAFPHFAHGHNDIVIHPLITDRAIALLLNSPNGALYQEISNYAGQDLNLSECPSFGLLDYLVSCLGVSDPYLGQNSIVNGSVMEDSPSYRSLDHFYDAATGQGLDLYTDLLTASPSKDKAVALWAQAFQLYDYTGESKQQAYFTMGRVVHLMEDLTSPAHVHDAPHFSFIADTSDAYEAKYLPDARFSVDFSGTAPTALSELLPSLWNTTPTALARTIYDNTTYQADLPEDFIGTPTGELTQMFPLSVVYDPIDSTDNPKWYLHGVGFYDPTANPTANFLDNDWWETIKTDLGAVPAGFYYLKSILNAKPAVYKGLDFSSISEDQRQTLPQIYADTQGNPRNLINPSVNNAAGLIQLFHDQAVPPVYLRNLIVKETPGGPVLQGETWTDVTSDHTVSVTDIFTGGSVLALPSFINRYGLINLTQDSVTVPQVDSRQLVSAVSTSQMLEAGNTYLIQLQFSRDVMSETSTTIGNFPLGFGDVVLLDGNGHVIANPIQFIPTDTTGQEWQITLHIPSLATLGGQQPRLAVKAKDKVHHLSSGQRLEGIGLDTDPTTPAKRAFAYVNGTETYAWVNYDRDNGGYDQTHTLQVDLDPFFYPHVQSVNLVQNGIVKYDAHWPDGSQGAHIRGDLIVSECHQVSNSDPAVLRVVFSKDMDTTIDPSVQWIFHAALTGNGGRAFQGGWVDIRTWEGTVTDFLTLPPQLQAEIVVSGAKDVDGNEIDGNPYTIPYRDLNGNLQNAEGPADLSYLFNCATCLAATPLSSFVLDGEVTLVNPGLTDIQYIKVDKFGNFYATYSRGGVVKYNNQGEVVAALGTFNIPSISSNLSLVPRDIAISPTGDVYVAGTLLNPITHFGEGTGVLHLDPDLHFISYMDHADPRLGLFYESVGLAFDTNGNLYDAQAGNGADRLTSFNRSGNILNQWIIEGHQDSIFSPAYVAVSSQFVFATSQVGSSTLEGKILRTDKTGNNPTTIALPGPAFELATDCNGYLYAKSFDPYTNSGFGVVQVVDPFGGAILGTADLNCLLPVERVPNDFLINVGLDVDQTGNIYTAFQSIVVDPNTFQILDLTTKVFRLRPSTQVCVPPTATFTPTETDTPVFTFTPTETETPTDTFTPDLTNPPTATPTDTPTDTPVPTDTPAPTPTPDPDTGGDWTSPSGGQPPKNTSYGILDGLLEAYYDLFSIEHMMSAAGEDGYMNEIWITTDGVNWTPLTRNAEFSPRAGHQAVNFDHRVWLLGGVGDNGHLGDVWNTNNGTTWTLANGNAFPPRAFFGAVVWDPSTGSDSFGEMWMFGGEGDNGYLNDFYSSGDGYNWTPEDTPPFSPRKGFSTKVFKGKIWMVGGRTETGLTNEVWSFDGTWVQAAPPPFTGREGHSCVVFDGKLWIIGGLDASGKLNEVWNTEDGETWQQVPQTASFTPRAGHISTVFKGKIWVVGGRNAAGEVLNDVWFSPPVRMTHTPTNTHTPVFTDTPAETHTPTDTGTDTPTNTPTDTDTPTSTDTPTNTSTDTATDTPTNTHTPTDTDTPTSTDTPTNTSTDTFTDTRTPTNTPTYTDTPTPTNTSTDTFTHTPTYTHTPFPTDTFTSTYTLTDTHTPTNTHTRTSTVTPVPTHSFTPTLTLTRTSTSTPVPTHTSTSTRTASKTPTPTSTPSPTKTPTPLPTKTKTPTFTPTKSFTPVPTRTPTWTPSPTAAAPCDLNPCDLQAKLEKKKVLLKWKAAKQGPFKKTDGYRVYRAPQAGGPFVLVGTVQAHGNDGHDNASAGETFVDKPGQGDWCYRVTAFKGSTESSPTNTACITVPKGDGRHDDDEDDDHDGHHDHLAQLEGGDPSQPKAQFIQGGDGPVDTALLQSVMAGPNISDGKQPIRFFVKLGRPAKLTLSLLSITGDQVYAVQAQGGAGSNVLTWEAVNRGGEAVASGLYLYVLQVDDGNQKDHKTGKIVILR